MTTPMWFEFVERLHPSRESDLTSLVTTLPDDFAEELSAEVRLDWWVHVGGVLRARLEKRLEQSSPFGVTFTIAMKPDPVLKFEITAWLQAAWLRKVSRQIDPRTHIRVVDREWVAELSKLSVENFEIDSVTEAASWYRRLKLPVLKDGLGAEFLRDMTASGVDLGEPPWILWSRLPPYLKRRRTNEFEQVFSEVDERLTFLRVALSPQDERNERASLTPHQLMVNPTFEFNESTKSMGPIVALARNWDTVSRRPITALEASVLDHVRESFRIERSGLLKAVSSETGVRKEFVGAAIDSLIADFFLLSSEIAQATSRDQ